MKLIMIFLALVSVSLACKQQKHSSPAPFVSTGDIPSSKEDDEKETPSISNNLPDIKEDGHINSGSSSGFPNIQVSDDMKNDDGISLPPIAASGKSHESTPEVVSDGGAHVPSGDEQEKDDDYNSEDEELDLPNDESDDKDEAPEQSPVEEPSSANDAGVKNELPAPSSGAELPTTAPTTLSCSLNGVSISSNIYAPFTGEMPSVSCTVLNFTGNYSNASPKLKLLSNSCGNGIKFNAISSDKFELKGNLGVKTSCSFRVVATDQRGLHVSSYTKQLVIKKGRFLVEGPKPKAISLGRDAFTASDKISFIRSGVSAPLSLEGLNLACESYTLDQLLKSGCPDNLAIDKEGQLSFFPLQKGTYLIRFKAINASGGKFLQSMSALTRIFVRKPDRPFIKTSTPFIGAIVNSQMASSWTLSGSCNIDGALVRIFINGREISLKGMCNGLNFSETLDLGQEADGAVALSLSLVDQFSGAALASDSIVLFKDSSPASVSISSHPNGASLKNSVATLFGLCSEVGISNVFIQYHGISKHTNCVKGAWLTSISLSVAEEGESFLLEVRHRDTAKNPEAVVSYNFVKYISAASAKP